MLGKKLNLEYKNKELATEPTATVALVYNRHLSLFLHQALQSLTYTAALNLLEQHGTNNKTDF